MSVTEILEQIHRLPLEQQYKVAEKVIEEFGRLDDQLTPDQMAELDRRAEIALSNPGRGTLVEKVSEEISKDVLARK